MVLVFLVLLINLYELALPIMVNEVPTSAKENIYKSKNAKRTRQVAHSLLLFYTQ